MQHVRHQHVAGIFELAGDLARSIQAADIGADELALVDVVLEQRGCGPRAVHDIAGKFDGLEDFGVARATANIAAEPLLDLVIGDERIGTDCGGCRHHHAGNAIAALAGAGFVERLLQHGKLA